MPRTMIFENGKVVIRGGDMPVIEPVGSELSAEEVKELFERHGFIKDHEDEEMSILL